MHMKRGDDEALALGHLIYHGVLSFDDAVSWAFDQYTDNGIDPFIEKVGLAIDLDEMYEILGWSHFGQHRDEFLVGEAASKFYEIGDLSSIMYIARRGGAGVNDISLPEDEAITLYEAVRIYDAYREGATDEAIQEKYDLLEKISLKLFDKYYPTYKNAVSRFIP